MFKSIELSSLVTLVLVVLGLFAYSFSGAQNWAAPSATPPGGNTLAPINVGTDVQVKQGNLGVNVLATAPTTGQVWSRQYCDENGANCFTASQVAGGGGTATTTLDLVNGLHSSQQCRNLGGQVVTSSGASFCRFDGASCPTGWIQYENWRTTAANTCRHTFNDPLSGSRSCAPCTTGSNPWSNTAVATCNYQGSSYYRNADGDRYLICGGLGGGSFTCNATINQVGCY
ncbi:hypothetical protein K2P47_03810 [Patescibacteria group bacterium]|nr:hypothetical protein [Patescibacteria group bacterium]